MLKVKYTAITTIILSAIGCGGGSSEPDTNNTNDSSDTVLTGIFVDSAVEGVSYSTATQSGITNALGQFNYMAGEQVTFSIGDTQLPTVNAAPQVSPVDMAVGSSNSVATTTNIARLLQSLDTDGIPDNGLTISPTAVAYAAPINFDVSEDQFSNDANVINLVANGGSVTAALISAADANAHLNDTLGGEDQTNPTVEIGSEFTLNMLLGRTLISSPIGEALNPHSILRFDSPTELYIAGTPNDRLSDGGMPWSLEDGGVIRIDFDSFESGTIATHRIDTVDGDVITLASTWKGVPDNPRSYTFSLPLSRSDFAGRTFTYQDTGVSGKIQFSDNGQYELSDSAGYTESGSYADDQVDGVQGIVDEDHDNLYVLAGGTLDNGYLMKLDYRYDNIIQARFYQTNGSQWTFLHGDTRVYE